MFTRLQIFIVLFLVLIGLSMSHDHERDDMIGLDKSRDEDVDDELDKDGGIFKVKDKSAHRNIHDPWDNLDLDELAPVQNGKNVQKRDNSQPTGQENAGSTTGQWDKEVNSLASELRDCKKTTSKILKERLEVCQTKLNKTVHQMKEFQERLSNSDQYTTMESLPYFKQFVREFKEKMKPLEGEENKYGIELMMFRSDYEQLEHLLQDDQRPPDNKQLLDLIVQAFKPLSRSSYVCIKPYMNARTAAIVVITLLILYIIHHVVSIPQSMMGRLTFLFFVVFVISVCWEYYRMYKMALAKKTASTMQLPKPPEQCLPVEKISELDALLIWFKDRFTLADDECVKYHENLLVDPFWEVSPMMAISVCLARFFLEPLKLCASAFGESFRLLFKEIPIQWQPFVFITLVLLTSLVILTHAGLEIWTPLIRLGFRPRKNDNTLALENENRQLRHDNDRLRLELDRRPALPPPPAPAAQGVQGVEEVGVIPNLVLPAQNFIRPVINQSGEGVNAPVLALDNALNLSRDQNAQPGQNIVIAQPVEEFGGRNRANNSPSSPIQEEPGNETLPDVMLLSGSSGVVDVENFHSLPSSTEEMMSANATSLPEEVDPSASNNAVVGDGRGINAPNQTISSQSESRNEQFEMVDNANVENFEEELLGANATSVVNDRALNAGQIEGQSEEVHQQQRLPVENSDHVVS
eukprot:TCONS_00061441-protein